MHSRFFAIPLMVVLLSLAAPAGADSPQETYENYLAVVTKANRLDELFPYLTGERIKTIEEGLARASDQGVDPGTVEAYTLELLRNGAAEEAKFREIVVEDEASVVVERAEVTVEVLMVWQDDGWKIADERMLRIPNFNKP